MRSSAGNSEKLKNQFYGALYESSNKHASEVIKTTDNYIIEKQQDSRLEADYLVLWGTLEDGNLVLMRTALASIKESVMIANEFLAYVAVMATVCCAILAIFVSPSDHGTNPAAYKNLKKNGRSWILMQNISRTNARMRWMS